MEEKLKVIVPRKYKRYYCKICNLYTNSDNQLNQHLEGVRHQQKKQNIRSSTTKFSNEHEYDSLLYIPAFIVITITIYIVFYIFVFYMQ